MPDPNQQYYDWKAGNLQYAPIEFEDKSFSHFTPEKRAELWESGLRPARQGWAKAFPNEKDMRVQFVDKGQLSYRNKQGIAKPEDQFTKENWADEMKAKNFELLGKDKAPIPWTDKTLQPADRYIKSIQHFRDNPKDTNRFGMGQMAHGFAKRLPLTFGVLDWIEMGHDKAAMDRMHEGTATDDDYFKLAKSVVVSEQEEADPEALHYLRTLSHLPAFAADMAVTGGLSAFTKAVGAKAAGKLAKHLGAKKFKEFIQKSMVKKIAGAGMESLTYATVMNVGRTMGEAIPTRDTEFDESTDTGFAKTEKDSWFNTLPKSIANQSLEYSVEKFTGAVVGKLGGKARTLLRKPGKIDPSVIPDDLMNLMKKRAITAWKIQNPGRASLAGKIGYNGMVTELGEEYLTMALQGVNEAFFATMPGYQRDAGPQIEGKFGGVGGLAKELGYQAGVTSETAKEAAERRKGMWKEFRTIGVGVLGMGGAMRAISGKPTDDPVLGHKDPILGMAAVDSDPKQQEINDQYRRDVFDLIQSGKSSRSAFEQVILPDGSTLLSHYPNADQRGAFLEEAAQMGQAQFLEQQEQDIVDRSVAGLERTEQQEQLQATTDLAAQSWEQEQRDRKQAELEETFAPIPIEEAPVEPVAAVEAPPVIEQETQQLPPVEAPVEPVAAEQAEPVHPHQEYIDMGVQDAEFFVATADPTIKVDRTKVVTGEDASKRRHKLNQQVEGAGDAYFEAYRRTKYELGEEYGSQPAPVEAQQPAAVDAQAIRDAEELLEARQESYANNPTSQQKGHVTRARKALDELQEALEAPVAPVEAPQEADVEAPPVIKQPVLDMEQDNKNVETVSQIGIADVRNLVPGRKVTETEYGFDVFFEGGRVPVYMSQNMDLTDEQLKTVYDQYVNSNSKKFTHWRVDSVGKVHSFADVFPTVEDYGEYLDARGGISGTTQASKGGQENQLGWDILATVRINDTDWSRANRVQMDVLRHELVHVAHLSGMWKKAELDALLKEFNIDVNSSSAVQSEGLAGKMELWNKPGMMERFTDWINRLMNKIMPGKVALKPSAVKNLLHQEKFWGRQTQEFSEFVASQDQGKQQDVSEQTLGMAEGESLEDTLKKKYPSLNKLIINETDTAIELQSIEVSSDSQQQGIGSDVVRQMQDYATKVGKPIILTQESSKGRKTALSKFYNKHGFKKPGSKKDFALPRHTDIWEPTTDAPMAMAEGDYRGIHKAPGRDNDYNASMDNMNAMYPDDIYSDDGARLYGDGRGGQQDRQVHQIIKNVRDNPDAMVTVYRGFPSDVKGNINPGDWVTPVRQYAEDHALRYDDDANIVEKQVRAGDLFTEGNSLYEFGWDPETKPTDDITLGMAESDRSNARLPEKLKGAEPRYGYGQKQFQLNFANDLDKALYIISNAKNRSNSDADYLAFAQELLPDKSEAQLRAMGLEIREAIKQKAKVGTSGQTLKIPSISNVVPQSSKPPTQQPFQHEEKLQPDPKKGDPKKKGALANPGISPKARENWDTADADRVPEVVTRETVRLEVNRRRGGTVQERRAADEEALEQWRNNPKSFDVFEHEHMIRWAEELSFSKESGNYELALEIMLMKREAVAEQARSVAYGKDPFKDNPILKRHSSLLDAIFNTDRDNLALFAQRKSKDPRKAKAGQKAFDKEEKRIEKIQKYVEKLGYAFTSEGMRKLARNRKDAYKVAQVAVRSKWSYGTWANNVFTEYTYANMLSGMNTQMVNLLSNTTWGTAMELEQFGAAAVNSIFGNHEAITMADYRAAWNRGEVKHKPAEMASIIKIAAQNGWTRLWTEHAVLEEQVGVEEQTKLERNVPAIPGVLGKGFRMIHGFGPMTAVDQFYKTLFTHMDVGVHAYSLARRQVEKFNRDNPKLEKMTQADITRLAEEMINDKTSEAWHDALREAEQKMFQDEGGEISQKVLGAAKTIRGIPIGGAAFQHLVAPFIRTPVRLMGNALIRMPGLGSIVTTMNMYKNHKAGKHVLDGVSREIVGQVTVALLAAAIAQGVSEDEEETRFTGAKGSLGKDSRSFRYHESVGPSQGFRMFGRWISYDRFDPFAVIMASIVDGVHAWKSGKGATGAAKDAALSTLASVQEKSFTRSLGDMMKLTEDDDSRWQRWIASSMTRLYPNLYQQMSRAGRETIGEKRGENLWEEFLQRAELARSEDIHDAWGRKAKSAGWLIPYVLPMPIRSKSAEDTFVGDRVFLNWNRLNPDAKEPAYPSRPSRDYIRNGVDRRMNKKLYADYTQMAGTLAYNVIGKMVSDKMGRNPSDQILRMVEGSFIRSRQMVKHHLMMTGGLENFNMKNQETLLESALYTSMVGVLRKRKPLKQGQPTEEHQEEVDKWQRDYDAATEWLKWYDKQ